MKRPLAVVALLFAMLFAVTTPAADAKPVKVLIITGDEVSAQNWKETAPILKNLLTKAGKPETRWSDENKKAFADAVSGGKGLVVYHFSSSAFTSGTSFDKEYQNIVAGGWRRQGNHGKRHVFSVAMRKANHPIAKDMPAEFKHANDELYQNSMIPPGSEVIATAYSDKSLEPQNSGKHEPGAWVP